jgi:glycosyltransferase involved in cell wall biosynthesis
MIEAMACGTPVIAYNRGAAPEIVEDGVTGFVVEDETSAIAAVKNISMLSRNVIRKRFEERFTSTRMAQDYLKAYERVCAQSAAKPKPRLVAG